MVTVLHSVVLSSMTIALSLMFILLAGFAIGAVEMWRKSTTTERYRRVAGGLQGALFSGSITSTRRRSD